VLQSSSSSFLSTVSKLCHFMLACVDLFHKIFDLYRVVVRVSRYSVVVGVSRYRVVVGVSRSTTMTDLT